MCLFDSDANIAPDYYNYAILVFLIHDHFFFKSFRSRSPDP